MAEKDTTLVYRFERFSKETMKKQDGKKIPLTVNNGEDVIGEATLKYVEEAEALEAHIHIDDPLVAKALKADPPSIFKKES